MLFAFLSKIRRFGNHAATNIGAICLRMCFIINQRKWWILKAVCCFGFQKDKQCFSYSPFPIARLSFENDEERLRIISANRLRSANP